MTSRSLLNSKLFILGLLCFASGCSTPWQSNGVVPISPDTFMASAVGYVGVDMGRVKKVVFLEASNYAESKGKVMMPLATNERPATFSSNASFELQFRVVAADDPEVKRVHLTPIPDMVIEKNERIRVDVHSKDENTKSPDIYTDLMKLDDLKKKGIITDSEFEREKKHILENR